MRKVFTITILLLVALCGCRSPRVTVETITRTDTVTVHRDSIIIHDRVVPVEVPLPPSIQYVEIPIHHDTTSVLNNGLYTSVAAVINGSLRHSLKSNPGASLTGSSVVHDTILVSIDSTAVNNSSSHSEVKEVTVNQLYWWQKALMWVGVLCLIGFAFSFFAWKRGWLK